MIRAIVLIVILVLLSACAASAPSMQHSAEGHQPGEQERVLEVLDRFIKAVVGSDPEAQEMHTPDGMTYQSRPAEGGGMQITSSPTSYWSDPTPSGRVVREQYWSPTVLIRSGIALVWAPYELWLNGETRHCGIMVFDFVKTDGRWLVSNSMWTVEPDACAELRPVDNSKLRPEY